MTTMTDIPSSHAAFFVAPNTAVPPKFAEHYGAPVGTLEASGDDRAITTFTPVRVITNG